MSERAASEPKPAALRCAQLVVALLLLSWAILFSVAAQDDPADNQIYPDEDGYDFESDYLDDYLDHLMNTTEEGKWLSIPGFGFFDACINPPPICPNSNITFWLYTRETVDSPHQLDPSVPESIEYAKWKLGHPIKVLIHGYTGYKDYSPNTEIRPAYLNYSDYNVISLDYGPLVLAPCYVQATYNVALVGNCTAQLLDMIVNFKIAPLEDIHVVGFSLGAQVAGNIANYLKSGKLTRITGLDPARPLFTTVSTEPRLDPTDAQFVDVIHTNAGWKGKLWPCGHVDFYLNSIVTQPGCSWDSSCNHARAPAYFAESIASPTGFWGFSCDSIVSFYSGLCSPGDAADMVLMGEHTNSSARGMYFSYTNPTFPFAKGQNWTGRVEAVHNATNAAGNQIQTVNRIE